MLYINYVLEYFSGKQCIFSCGKYFWHNIQQDFKFFIDKYLTRHKDMNIMAIHLISIGARVGAIGRGTTLKA